MNELKLETTDGRTSFAPGDTLEAVAEWQLDTAPDAVELRLIWFTRGDDDEDTTYLRDMSIVDRLRFDSSATSGAERWTVRLPNGPYSFSGLLVSLAWALELVAEPVFETHRLEITVAPRGHEIVLHSATRGDESI